MSMSAQPSRLDRLLRPIHRWVWRDAARRGRKLLRFAETEEDGGRDLSRAAELTDDPLLRRLFLRHALDEHRHADLFRRRGRAILGELRGRADAHPIEANWFAPGERGLDDLRVERERQDLLLAFLHLSEKAAAGRFAMYQEVLEDLQTRRVFDEVLKDEVFHMSYTQHQLSRIAPDRHRLKLWQARLGRFWRAYLRLAAAVAGILGTAMLFVQYFLILPPFAWMAKRAQRREPQGWFPKSAPTSLKRQY
jgi:rubrerythrin